MPESANSFRITAEYHEGTQIKSAPAPVTKGEKGSEPAPRKPCVDNVSDITICASINFDPLIRPSFRDLDEGFSTICWW